MADPIMPTDKTIIDFVHDIEFSEDIKPKLEIKDDPIDMKSCSDIKPKISQFTCGVCNFDAPDLTSLDLHFTKKHGQQDGQSVRTPDQSKNKLMGKLKMSFIKKYQCEICHFNPVKGMSLEMHLAAKKHL